MCDPKLQQIRYESDAWKRLLIFMMDENTHLKNRLSAVIKEQPDNSLIDDLEVFLSRFVIKDEILILMRHELAELDSLFNQDMVKDDAALTKLCMRLHQFRRHMIHIQIELSYLHIDFTNYLTNEAVEL